MQKIISWLIRLLPDGIVEEINATSLDELDKRGLIIWVNENQACK